MIVDGKSVAEGVYLGLLSRRSSIARSVTLGVVVGVQDPVIESFVRIKERAAERLNVTIVRKALTFPYTTDDAVKAVKEFAETVDGVIVQLPLPGGIDSEAVLAAIPNEKDVDAISSSVEDERRLVRAPVAGAVEEILRSEKVDAKGKKATVVGYGRLVGKPAALLLRDLGAEVTIVTEDKGSLDELKNADIVILGAGDPGHIRPQHLKNEVVLIDAGTSEQSGRVVGDADPACADVASVFTPVPGGVGPVAVSMIFKNLFDLKEKAPK